MPKVSDAHLEQRRNQILEAAVTCFARRGFHQTTMADIAAEAGISDTLAYRYFSGKQELIEEAVRHHEGLSVEAVTGTGGEGFEDLRALLNVLLTNNMRRFDEPREIEATMGMYLRSWSEALHDDNVRAEVLDRWNHHLDVAEGLVIRAQDQGQIAGQFDPRSIAWVMIALHYGLNILAVLNPEVDLEKCRDVVLSMSFGDFATVDAKGSGTGG